MNPLNAPLSPGRPLLVVAGALFDSDGRVLVQRRTTGRHAGLWEFPGGKVEPGEAIGLALARELEEELGLVIAPGEPTPLAFAIDDAGDGELLLLLFLCRRWSGEPRAVAADALRWVELEALATLVMPPADIVLASALTHRLAR